MIILDARSNNDNAMVMMYIAKLLVYPVTFFIHRFSFFISVALALKSSLHGISSPPCGRSAEYLLLPDTLQVMEPPLLRNMELTLEILLGRCPMIVPFFTTAIAYMSVGLVGSLTLLQ